MLGAFRDIGHAFLGILKKGRSSTNRIPGSIEETQIKEDQIASHTYAGPFYPEAEDVIFEAHWFLLESKTKEITLDWEHDECQWIEYQKLPKQSVVPWLPTLIEHLFAKQAAE